MMTDASTLLHRISRTTLHACVAAALIVSVATLGGCAGNSAGPGDAYAMAPSADGTTIAFDQIDGPPPQVFDRMVNVLDIESKLRSLLIGSHERAAAHHLHNNLVSRFV